MLALLITLGYLGAGYYVGVHMVAPKALKEMKDDYFFAATMAIFTGLFWPITLLGLGAAHVIKVQHGKDDK